MQKTILYQKSTSENTKVWTIEVINHGSHSEVLSTRGILNGKMAPTSELIHVGKGNKTHYEQACSDAQSKINSKTKKGYVSDITKIQSSSVLGSGNVPAPMLAEKYDPTKKQSKSRNLKDLGLENKEIVTQRKKDGNRCLIHVDLNGIQMYSRKGDKVPNLSHITESVLENFKRIYNYVNTKYGVTEYWLDGELYTKAFSFNKLNGLARKITKDAQDEKDALLIKYHLYDIVINAGYETRYKILRNFKSSTVWVEEAEFIIATEKNIQEKLEKYLAEGEEGLMIRVLGVGYENKRTWQLCKVKNFEDKEFKVIGFEEDSRGGMAASVIVEHDVPGAKDRDGKEIKTFNAGCTGSHEEWKEMWENQHKYIGKWATVEFFGRSEYTTPRFPKVKGFRNDK
jgi:ATP-dependent DNA ligase